MLNQRYALHVHMYVVQLYFQHLSNNSDLQCWEDGLCQSILVKEESGIDAEACLEECQSDVDCQWLTHDSDGDVCLLFGDCPELDTSCPTCSSSQQQCSPPPPPEEEQSYTKIVVIGGSNDLLGGDLSSVEVVDLEDPSATCDLIADYPVQDSGMVAGVIGDLIKSCGSHNDRDDCYDYNPATNVWTTSASMLTARYRPRASFIDDVWLVSGDGFDDSDRPYFTEMWTGTEFEQGPRLRVDMTRHCQLTVNSTHVFFVDTSTTNLAFLYNWYEETWTDLPATTGHKTYPSCGLINNPDNGPEVVITEDGDCEIFNVNSMSWRQGPQLATVSEAGFAQISGDTFVVVGGDSYETGILDTIYVFDNVNYEWILLSQRLKIARRNSPGVVAVPDSFVSCS